MQSPLIVNETTIDDQQHYDGVFPLVLVNKGDCSLEQSCEWLTQHRTSLLGQLDRHGVILFRDFPWVDATSFDQAIAAFDLPNFTYADSLSNAVRVNRTERVFTANEAPADVTIYLHHEMAQTPIFPSRLFFFCEKSADKAGQTPVCRSDVLFTELEKRVPKFIENCLERGVKYTNVMPEYDDLESGQGRSWRSTLGTESREYAEERLTKLDYSWAWGDAVLSVTTPVLPAVRTLNDGRRVFFNQLIAAFRGWADQRNDPQKSIRFGDDSIIDTEDMRVAIELADQLTFDLPWQSGDMVMVDNFTVMHGRRPFEGTRRVLASLIANDGSRLALE